MSKLKTISDLEKKCLVGESWYDNEDNITEYQDIFFDELLFDLGNRTLIGKSNLLRSNTCIGAPISTIT